MLEKEKEKDKLLSRFLGWFSTVVQRRPSTKPALLTQDSVLLGTPLYAENLEDQEFDSSIGSGLLTYFLPSCKGEIRLSSFFSFSFSSSNLRKQNFFQLDDAERSILQLDSHTILVAIVLINIASEYSLFLFLHVDTSQTLENVIASSYISFSKVHVLLWIGRNLLIRPAKESRAELQHLMAWAQRACF